MAQAEVPDRAEEALGRAARHTDGCPKFHEGLIEDSDIRLRRWENLLNLSADGFFGLRSGNVAVIVCQTGDHSKDVAVHRGFRLGEAGRSNGGGGVVSHAGKLQKPGVIVRKTAAVHHQLGGLLQVPGPAVIAQSLPELHELFFGGGSQSFHRGEGL